VHFSPKKDILFACLVWVPVFYVSIIIIIELISSLISGEFETELSSFIVPCIFIGMLLSFWFNTRYTIEGSVLKIRYGIFKKTINIEQIRTITSTRSVARPPALSIDKIELHYGRLRTISVSPLEKAAFIHQLTGVNENIKVESKLENLER